MNTKLNKSDWVILLIIYGINFLFTLIDYFRIDNTLLEFLIDLPTSIIISISMILIFLYVLIPKFLIHKKKYLIFIILSLITLTVLGSLDNLIGYLTQGVPFKKYPSLIIFLQKGLYAATDMIGFPFGILLAKKFYEGQTELVEAQKQQKENELKLLRSQLDPHFLFNNLNTLDALIDNSPTKAKEYINRLSLIYRYLIQTKDSEVMELSEELTLAENYIFLIKTRFGNDYSFNIDKKTLVDDKFIPTGAIQTLLENVVKHNKVQNENTIKTDIVIDENWLKITNQKSKIRSKNPSFGTGLENLKTRYKLLTDKEVVIINTDDEFSVSIPIINLEE